MAVNGRQRHLRSQLLDCLGGDRPVLEDVTLRFDTSTAEEGCRRVKVSYAVEVDEPVAAWLLVPDNVNEDRTSPAVAVWHQHNNQWELGMSEAGGPAGDPQQHVDPKLARAGYVVLFPHAARFDQHPS